MRCKFRLDSIKVTMGSAPTGERNPQGHPIYEPRRLHSLEFNPVYGNNDPEHENTKFWVASPQGKFMLDVVNAVAVAGLEVGREYYVDVTPAA